MASTAASWTHNSLNGLVKADHWQRRCPVDINTGGFLHFTFYDALRDDAGIHRTNAPKDGRVRKGNDRTSAEPEMMGWE